jgi:hypothetical protein
MKGEIDKLDSAKSVNNFFKKTQVMDLSRQDKYDLLIKIAELDIYYQLRSYSAIILHSFKSHNEGFRYWVPIIISNVFALVAAIASILAFVS